LPWKPENYFQFFGDEFNEDLFDDLPEFLTQRA